MGVAHSFSSGSVCVVTYSLHQGNAMSFFVALYFTIYQPKQQEKWSSIQYKIVLTLGLLLDYD